MDARLEEQASLLAGSDWNYGEINRKTYTVSVECRILPKEYSPAETEATILCNGKEYPMMLTADAYTVQLDIPLMEESRISAVKLIEGGTVRTEELDWYFSPRYECLPVIYAFFGGETESRVANGNVIRTYDGGIEISIDQRNNEVRSVEIVSYIDEKEMSRKAVALSENYHLLTESVSVPFGSVYELYVEAEDENGLRYRVLIDQMILDEQGKEQEETGAWRTDEADIYDKNGNVLYEDGGR